MQQTVEHILKTAKVGMKIRIKDVEFTIQKIQSDEPNEEGFETKFLLHNRHGDDHDLTFLFTESEEIHFEGVFADGRQLDLKDIHLL
jgi:hypothetical protein